MNVQGRRIAEACLMFKRRETVGTIGKASPNANKRVEKPQVLGVRGRGSHEKDSFVRVTRMEFGLTSKMSHGHSGRAACGIPIRIPSVHFRGSFNSTQRDRCGRWLWRLVRPILH